MSAKRRPRALRKESFPNYSRISPHLLARLIPQVLNNYWEIIPAAATATFVAKLTDGAPSLHKPLLLRQRLPVSVCDALKQ
eukprot:scaffold223048_cov14-Tisochrysis_lutea.AAC.1